MVYEYNSQIYLAEVALNVKDLESQTAFYHQLLGLEILNQSENQVLLGAGGKPLVRLIKTDDISIPKQSYGLYLWHFFCRLVKIWLMFLNTY